MNAAADSSVGRVTGIYVDAVNYEHKVDNFGNITLNLTTNRAESTNDDAYANISARGILATGKDITINSNGIVSITGTSGTAISENSEANADIDVSGIISFTSGNSTVGNSGTINIQATGGSASGEDTDTIDATTFAIGVTLDGGNTVFNNSGIINVTAIGGTATNSDTGGVNVDVQASGVFILNTASALLTNTGFINASVTVKQEGAIVGAYEAFAESDFTVDTWATTLRTWGAYDTVFGLYNGQKINFANGTQGANLILRPDTAERGFALDTPYYVANMVAINADTTGSAPDIQLQDEFAAGKIEGSIASVSTEVNFLTANLYNQGTNNPSVSLSLDESNLPTSMTAQAVHSAFTSQMSNISTQLRDRLTNVYANANYASSETDETASLAQSGIAAGSTSVMNNWSVFATPYSSYSKNSHYNYNSGTYGFTAGASYNFSEQLLAGFHFDFNASNADADHVQNDLTSFAIGLHANYFVNKNWYVGGNASYAFGFNDIEHSQSFGKASDDYSSSAFFASVNSGYVFEINKNNIIIPEIVLSYLYTSTGSYSLHFVDPHHLYNMDANSNSNSDFFAEFNLNWQGQYALESGALTPSAGLGIRQSLTDSDIDSSVDMLGTRFDTTANSDSTKFLARAGLEYTSGNFSIGVNYNGEFGSDQQGHMGSLNFKYRF